MPTAYLSIPETNAFSKLICNYLEKTPQLKPLYHQFPNLKNFKLQIKEKQAETDLPQKRLVLQKVLKAQYQNVNISEATTKHIQELSQPNTFTITTGHQLNLFTGPLYFLYKIISTINLCKQLKNEYPNYNFVPIYWMATEDHDFEEINFFNFKNKKITWNSEQKGAVGTFNTKGLDKVFKQFAKTLNNSTNATQLKTWFSKAYLEHKTLAAATRYLANALFGNQGLVVLDANDKQLKQQFIPHLKTELFEQISYEKVVETNKIIEDLGYKIQVNPRQINLFYITEGLRERIVLDGDIYKVNNTNITWRKTELLAHVEQHPEQFSPNVITRPLYQEVVLPNLCYIGGGGELAYWLQLKNMFKVNNVTFPMLLLRNSVVIKSEKQAKKQQALNLSNADLFLKPPVFEAKFIKSISAIPIDFSKQIANLKQQFKALYELANQTDKSFIGAVKAQEVKQTKGLKHLKKRLLKAQKRKLSNELQRANELKFQLFPNQSLQERYVNFSELYEAYGEDLITTLIKTLNPLKSEFTILEL